MLNLGKDQNRNEEQSMHPKETLKPKLTSIIELFLVT